VSGPLRSAELQLRAARNILPRARLSRRRFGKLDDRLVLVVGSPRSGTTFLAGALGSLPGFIDLGEVAPLKAAIPDLAGRSTEEAAPAIRRILTRARRLGLVGSLRPVEQTPETAFVLPAVLRAFPEARIVHVLRDGRDVACSLLERGWLRAGQEGTDDAGNRFGPEARFWVEPGRRSEFASVGDARRAAWAWRRYVTAVRESGVPVVEVRYERLAADSGAVAAELAAALGAAEAPLTAALGKAHGASVGRHARDLTEEELADVLAECGSLLHELGYLPEA
jgi:DNA-binding transcriptional ArsR family regulator